MPAMTWPWTAHGTDACAEAHRPARANSPMKMSPPTFTTSSVAAGGRGRGQLLHARFRMRYWPRFGEVQRDAGFSPDQLQGSYDDAYLFGKLIFPTRAGARGPQIGRAH